MKVVVATGPNLPVPAIRGGAAHRFWEQIAPVWASQGVEVIVMARADPDQPRSELTDGVRFYRSGGFNNRNVRWLDLAGTLWYAFCTSVRMPRADLYITNDVFSPWLMVFCGRAARTLVAAFRAPKGQFRFVSRRLSVAVPSRAMRRAIITEAPHLGQRTHVLPNAIDTIAFYPPEACDPRRDEGWLYAGRIHPEKGVHLLIAAFRRLHAERPGSRLVLIGPTDAAAGGGGATYRSELDQAASGLPVEWLPPCYSAESLADVYRSCRYFVYPSLAEAGESFGVAPLEAMACGATIIVSGLACFADFVEDGRNGYVFDHHNDDPVESLHVTMQRALAHSEAVPEAAVETARRFSVNRVAETWLNVMRRIAEEAQ